MFKFRQLALFGIVSLTQSFSLVMPADNNLKANLDRARQILSELIHTQSTLDGIIKYLEEHERSEEATLLGNLRTNKMRDFGPIYREAKAVSRSAVHAGSTAAGHSGRGAGHSGRGASAGRGAAAAAAGDVPRRCSPSRSGFAGRAAAADPSAAAAAGADAGRGVSAAAPRRCSHLRSGAAGSGAVSSDSDPTGHGGRMNAGLLPGYDYGPGPERTSREAFAKERRRLEELYAAQGAAAGHSGRAAASAHPAPVASAAAAAAAAASGRGVSAAVHAGGSAAGRAAAAPPNACDYGDSGHESVPLGGDGGMSGIIPGPGDGAGAAGASGRGASAVHAGAGVAVRRHLCGSSSCGGVDNYCFQCHAIYEDMRGSSFR